MGRRAPKPVRPSLNPSAWAPTTAYPSIDWRQPLKRNCVRCGIVFLVTGANVRACLDCRPKHKKERRGKYYRNVVCADGRKKENKRQNEARARRCPPKMKVCVICGNEFLANRSAITCSPDCSRQRRLAYRQEYDEKNRDAVNRKRREKWRANRDKINAARREKWRANRDKINAARRGQREKRRESISK
jgi:hypothetical protein